jgi:hypothetical protein
MSLLHPRGLCQSAELNIIFLPAQPTMLKTLGTQFFTFSNDVCILMQGVQGLAVWQKACKLQL